MIKIYNTVLIALGIVLALWFLPWLYDIVFPSDNSDPFVMYSPVSASFVVSTTGEDQEIFTVDSKGQPLTMSLTKNDRDSLLPQMYFNQLNAKGVLPDSVAGRAIDVPTLKHGQWVFNSLPRDINRVAATVYPIMESMPKRVDLEDPTEVFTLDGKIEFLDMATNTVDAERSRRFNQVFEARQFAYPVVCTNANITAKKQYDEGYLLVDANGRVFHLKMQAGRPYMAAVNLPADVKATQAFILENPDTRHIGLVATDDHSLYAIERSGYKAVRLPVEDVDPKLQRITIFKSIFNWVIKISDGRISRWVAMDADDYSLLGVYSVERQLSKAQEVARWIFPMRITFTDINDCYAYPRISDFSLNATIIWLLIALCLLAAIKVKGKR